MDNFTYLRSKITDAFSSIPHPGKENVTEHQCEECDELRDTFGPLEWQRVPPEIIDANFGQLPLFTPEAFRYFLPSYILRCLDNFDSENSVCEFVIYAVAPTGGEDWEKKRYAERISLFSSEQRAAVAAFLKHVQATEEFYYHHTDAIAGMQRYWAPTPEDAT